MRLKVTKYLPEQGNRCHRVIDLDDRKTTHGVLVDILVDGGLGPEAAEHPESLVGKLLYCDYTHPYISIAQNVHEACPVCYGTGGGNNSPCDECGGKGFIV